MDLATPQLRKTGLHTFDVTHGSDESLFVEFENKPIQNNFQTEQQGRPIFEDQTFIKITFPGDKTKQVYRPIKDEDKIRFSRQWQSFELQGKVELQGTPVEEWAPITKSQAMELKGLNIHTVEALSGLPDVSLTWLGSRQLRDKATAWLESAKDGAVILAARKENEDLNTKIATLENQIKDLVALSGKTKKEKE